MIRSRGRQLVNRFLADPAGNEAYYRCDNDPPRSLSVAASRRVRLPARAVLRARPRSGALGLALVGTNRRGPMDIPAIKGRSPIRAVVHVPGKCIRRRRHSAAERDGNANSYLSLGKHFIFPLSRLDLVPGGREAELSIFEPVGK